MVPVIDNIDICAKHQATSLWFKNLQTPVSFCSTSALFTFHINAFLVLVRKEQVCCEAEVRCLSFVVCLSSHECWHSSFHVCACWCPQSRVCSGSHTDGFLPKLSAPGLSDVVLVIQLCAAKPAGRECELAWWDINWNADTEPLLLSLLRVIGVVILGGGVLSGSWSGQKGERQRAIILGTGSLLLCGQILTSWDKGKPKSFGLAFWPVGVALITKGYLLFICLLWCCCFASANLTLWPV